MTTVLAFLVMLLIVAGMSVGVMMGRKPIAGSCGGMKALGLGMDCEVCGGDPNACEQADRFHGAEDEADAASLATDAALPRRGDHVRTL